MLFREPGADVADDDTALRLIASASVGVLN
jgi:hypothetical protein